MPLATPSDRHAFIVIGAGSAGCIIARRLADAGRGSVLLIEAGDAAERHPETLSADGFVKAFSNPATLWDRLSVPQKALGGRHVYLGSGTGMGGSGAVNGMVYTRGDCHDFAQWPEGWQWDDLLPAFEAVESRLRVQTRPGTRFTDRCLAAGMESGFERKDRLDDGQLAGYMGYQLMNYDGDRRRHSYAAFLADSTPHNVKVMTQARVTRIVIDQTRRAVGIRLTQPGEGERYIAADVEVILCAGALETPRLLLLSGIGPADELKALGIEVHQDAPGVGRHLQDHPNVCVFYRGRHVPDSFYPQVYGFARMNPALPLQAHAPDTCFVFYTAAASLPESAEKMVPTLVLPPALYARAALKRVLGRVTSVLLRLWPASWFISRLYGLIVILGKPQSRGTVRLQSADPAVPALIDVGWLSHPADMDTLVAGVQRVKAMAASSALQSWGATPISAAARSEARETIEASIRASAMTTFHYCGTVRMGPDADSPVDTRLRVKGISGLRVADASVMPVIPVAALNAPTMAIAWRAADFIIEEHSRAGSRRAS